MSTNRILTASRYSDQLFLPKTPRKPAFVAVPGMVWSSGPTSVQLLLYHWAKEQALAETANEAQSYRPLRNFELN